MLTVHAQEAAMRAGDRQVQLVVDNDAYFFTDYDRYYSSGIFASYSQLISQPVFFKSLAEKAKKLTGDLRFSHYMYTPKNILWRTLDQLDRPYAGMMTAGGSLNFYFNKSALLLGADMGWLGPGTKTGELQVWWHKMLDIRLPRGWEYQINNTPVIILQPEYLQRLVHYQKMDLVSRSGLAAGTVFNKVFQEVTVRYGRPGALHQSQIANSLPGTTAQSGGKYAEWYLFASMQANYVVHNATIDGNFVGPKSLYTEASVPFVWQQTFGVMVAGKSADFELSFKINTKEVAGAEQHRYMRAKVSYRF